MIKSMRTLKKIFSFKFKVKVKAVSFNYEKSLKTTILFKIFSRIFAHLVIGIEKGLSE